MIKNAALVGNAIHQDYGLICSHAEELVSAIPGLEIIIALGTRWSNSRGKQRMYPRLLGIYAFGRFSRAKTDRKEFLCQEIIKAQKDIRAIHANNLGYTRQTAV